MLEIKLLGPRGNGVFTSETHIKDISAELVAYRQYYSN